MQTKEISLLITTKLNKRNKYISYLFFAYSHCSENDVLVSIILQINVLFNGTTLHEEQSLIDFTLIVENLAWSESDFMHVQTERT